MTDSYVTDLQNQVNALVQFSTGIEAGRRVGWAKYYDEATQHENSRHALIRRLATVIKVTEELENIHMSKKRFGQMITRFVEEILVEAGDWDVYQEAKTEAVALVRARWGTFESMAAALVVPEDEASHDHEGTSQYRCNKCNKLLGKLTLHEVFSAKCSRCTQVNTFKWGNE